MNKTETLEMNEQNRVQVKVGGAGHEQDPIRGQLKHNSLLRVVAETDTQLIL